MDKKTIKSLIKVTRSRAKICYDIAVRPDTIPNDAVLYNGKAHAYQEMTELLEELSMQ